MALTIDTQPGPPIEIEEYLESVESLPYEGDEATLEASAPMFRRLVENKRVVTKFLNARLRDWLNFQSMNPYTGQVFILSNSGRVGLRANIWTPGDIAAMKSDPAMYAYLYPHDHNVAFLTGGYHGAGYETDIFEIEPVRRRVGDVADLRFLEHTELPTGKLMLYRASRDVHMQYPPKEMSISLNAAFLHRDLDVPEQYVFDASSGRVENVYDADVHGTGLLTSLGACIGDDRTRSLLDGLSTEHGSPRVRAGAIGALAILSPEAKDELALRAERDADPDVRAVAVTLA